MKMLVQCSLLILFSLVSVVAVRAADSDDSRFDAIEPIVRRGIEAGQLPGAVVAVADSTKILYLRAFGDRQIEPTREALTTDTIFDLASLTKPVATATSVMLLVQRGEVDLDQPVAKYLPEFAVEGKEAITVRDLMLHVGGMIPDNSIRDYQQGIDVAWERLFALKPRSERGEKFVYSDVGFLILGKLVERVSGKTLDQFTREEIFQPMGMETTSYKPDPALRDLIAATEPRDGALLRGKVHDPRAALLDGVAGHAGLFSTAEDLVRYGQMILSVDDETTSAPRVLDQKTIAAMIQPHRVPRGTRTPGWDHQSPYSSNRGTTFSDSAVGHGGFTGTVLWIDPEKDRVFVFLSSRLYPDGKGSVNRLAGEIATIIGR
ncbi:Penicillin-binding protein 4* [Rosistilla ulvae]|uniref:Penicillin-binding protein 4 n=1 Tax=Rosistilla ulvae TaxID=1930277 RepID=A0A517LZG7_9BACT|nr:serine hydrolase domain-containing protein [Rosistilla ulvae]QDS88009.1 Penicillin-binding protein 4* [Rosistilla ulvae]